MDGFFVPSNVPFGYASGLEGVEVLEFRHDNEYNFKFTAKAGSAFWDKALEMVRENYPTWQTAPTEMAHG